MQPLASGRPLLLDGLLAAGLGAIAVQVEWPFGAWRAVAIAGVSVATVLARRRWPVPALLVALAAALTDREREIMVLAAHGLSNEEVAARLFLSPLTAKTHVNRAMTKLGVRDRAQLVVLAYQRGLVQAGDRLP